MSETFEVMRKEVAKAICEADYTLAEAIIRKELKTHATDSDYLALMGKVCFCSGQKAKANEYYRQAFYYNNDSVNACAGLIFAAESLSEVLDCEQLFEKIKDATTEDAYLAQYAYLRFKNRLFDAVTIMRSAYGEHPNSLVVAMTYVDALAANCLDAPEISEVFEQMNKLYPFNGQVIEAEIKYLYKSAQYDKCRRICKKTITKFPNSEAASYALMISKRIQNLQETQTRQVEQVKIESSDSRNLDEHMPSRSVLGNAQETHAHFPAEESKVTVDKAMAQLNRLIGLSSVKEEITRIHKKLEFDKIRRERLHIEEAEPDSFHFVFYGNPGTGKTTVARLLGDIFHSFGMIEKGHLIEVDRSDLVGEYQGHTAQKTKKVVEQALGGVLFIDEAYSLCNGENDDFGKEAIDVLVKAVEDHRHEFVVILAGYKQEMYNLIKSNVGLESRFTKHIDFPDYTEEELLEIARLFATENHYSFSADGEIAFKECISKRKVNKKFGNAREVRNLMSEAFTEKAMNFEPTTSSIEYLTILTPRDFGIDIKLTPEQNAQSALQKLQRLIGLSVVKQEVNSMMSLVSYYKEEQKITRSSKTSLPINMHMCFTGNPGTGKTTVARIYSEILAAIGVLKTGELIEVSRGDLVGRYQGETAIKVAECCERAYGGILFIDEAYSLVQSDNDSFGLEAVATLIKEMEDHRDKLVVILAGYSDEMRKFMDTNSGIASRIGKTIEFPDYTETELYNIFEGLLAEGGIQLSDDAEKRAHIAVHELSLNKGRNFGNGRDVRSLYEAVLKNMVARVQMQGLGGAERKRFLPEDFPDGGNRSVVGKEAALSKLNQLVGLTSVKQEVCAMLDLSSYQQKEREAGRVVSRVNMHLCFTGNPGTGKTTVARIYAEVLASIGILQSGNIVEVSRPDLVGQWQGHTAQKTREQCEKAYGGILFVDEAYSLMQGANDSFGSEAIATLIKEMEDHRDNLVVIFAGYSDEMRDFMNANSGIASRIAKTIEFPDYNEDELMEIFDNLCSANRVTFGGRSHESAQKAVSDMYRTRDAHFGNGRDVRNLYEAAFKRMVSRVETQGLSSDARRQFLPQDFV